MLMFLVAHNLSARSNIVSPHLSPSERSSALMVSTLNSLTNCCGHESLSRSIVRFSVLVTSVCVVDVLQSSQSCSSKQRKAHPYSTTDNLVINKNKTTQNTLASIKEENTAMFLTRLKHCFTREYCGISPNIALMFRCNLPEHIR
jgi:hypothetical protein